MSRRRYFEEQRSGNGAIYHCVKTDLVKEEEVMAAEEAASDTLWFMPEPAVMVLC